MRISECGFSTIRREVRLENSCDVRMESLREVSSFRPPNETARGTHAAFLRSLTSAHASLRVTAASALASPSPLREAALLSWMRIVVILPSSSLVRFRLFSLSDMYTDLCTSLHPDALECMEKLNYQKKKKKTRKKKRKKNRKLEDVSAFCFLLQSDKIGAISPISLCPFSSFQKENVGPRCIRLVFAFSRTLRTLDGRRHTRGPGPSLAARATPDRDSESAPPGLANSYHSATR